ncbi:hypothetical protein R6Q57_001950 [Mikania cordata]
MILKYLIPVKLSIGILPKESLLEKYNLVEYSDIVLAMKRGDFRLLRHVLEEHEDRYIIQKQKDPSKAHQIKLEMIVKALKWLEMEMDLDEVMLLDQFLFALFSCLCSGVSPLPSFGYHKLIRSGLQNIFRLHPFLIRVFFNHMVLHGVSSSTSF